MSLLRRLRTWWANRPCYTQHYPPGWRIPITVTCETAERMAEIDLEDAIAERETARRLVTRPESV